MALSHDITHGIAVPRLFDEELCGSHFGTEIQYRF